MKHNETVDSKLDALLAEMPVAESSDFSARVLESIADERLDVCLKKMPIEPSSDFADRVLSELTPAQKNTVAFPRSVEFFRVARNVFAGIAAAVVACIGFFSLENRQSLRDRVDFAVESDPELAALVVSEEELSWNELVEASQLLAVLNENSETTSAFFAYYED